MRGPAYLRGGTSYFAQALGTSNRMPDCVAPTPTAIGTSRPETLETVKRLHNSERWDSLARATERKPSVRAMNVPLLGPLTLSGFANGWFFLYIVVILAVTGLYLVVQRARRKRVMRFANMDVLERVAPKRSTRWRHVPAALLIAALALLTTAMAGPTDAVRIPRNRAVVMFVIDVSESMVSDDVAPSRLAAAKEAGKQFTDELTPGINLGLVAFAGTASLLVAPTTDRDAMKAAIGTLKAENRTATGEGIYTALQAIATVGAVLGREDGRPAPARIVLESDGKETVPSDPDQPRGAYTAARAAKEQGVPISTISFGTPDGYVDINDQHVPVPVDDETLQKITEITGGQSFHAGNLNDLETVYATLQQQIGYETVHGDASASWIRLGAIALAASVLAGVLVHRRLPG
ncbi:MAG: Ca-activated chloride channel [Mycobacterium sp.]|jgi:Ca-activated chloride channel family protein|nr:Ca-activated chloride channel [Mycobacterium sp.]